VGWASVGCKLAASGLAIGEISLHFQRLVCFWFVKVKVVQTSRCQARGKKSTNLLMTMMLARGVSYIKHCKSRLKLFSQLGRGNYEEGKIGFFFGISNFFYVKFIVFRSL
jgi:hypothetical protein